ncbi:MAG: glycosyltransferase [Bacteroidales bacterium]|nr:glycosyltransferase [Bacteroidales bacterium]MDD4178392.1 glycosyltransferase [Bacteroidales bacterium]MDD4742853.1 glycosyltransferase [Bacteroidales bacterium]NCU37108.1 glycosyltransferase [Candidatus Falkowbacteria bacterium]
MTSITFHPALAESSHRFSIVIPTWNNLPHLQLLVRSIREHSRYQHQIVVHVNEGSDGTRQWVEQQNFSYSYSEKNVGVCFAFNAAASLAKSDFLLLIDDDNYLLPDWDFYLWQEVEKIGHPYFSVSATKIEPRKTFNPCVIAPQDFGHSPDTFRESELLAQYKSYQHADWNGSSWYPLVVHRRMWDMVGGLSTEFTPGMYSDPDFMMKLWQAGVRYYKGVSASRSYHFISKSVRRIKKNDGRRQFLLKWRISNSTFRTEYLRMGTPFDGALPEPQGSALRWKKLKDKLKLFFAR